MEKEKLVVRTDLAFEALDETSHSKYTTDINYKKIQIKKTNIDEELANETGRKVGLYYLLDLSEINFHDTDDARCAEDALTQVIKEILNVEGINQHSKGLIVGLGNVNITPDSLGPLVIDNVIVTRHMFLLEQDISEGIANVSAIAPGVMGNTGIETTDIVASIVEKIEVDYVLAIDALASSSINRVNKTIQVTNTGIAPGSGVGNRRREISRSTLNLPVIAIGVPTVVDAVTITANTIDFMLRFFNEKINHETNKLLVNDTIDYKKTSLPNAEYQKELLGSFGTLNEAEKQSLISDVLSPNGLNMLMTPKEVDADINDLAMIISSAIDRSLHTIVNG